MTDDGYGTTITFAVNWARSSIEPLLNNTYFTNNTLIVLTFDENETYTIGNKVLTILLGGAIPSSAAGTADSTFYTHYSMLSTVLVHWGLPSLGRWDCGANVLQLVANKTGYQNSAVGTQNLYFNTSYPGALSDTQYLPIWPIPNTNSVCASSHGVLSSILSMWGTCNYTNVYPYDTVSGNNIGGSPVVAAFQGSSSSSGTPSSPGSNTGSGTTQTSTGATSPSTNSSNGILSTGARIGIGVSIPILVIILTVLAYFLLRRRRRQQSGQISGPNPDALEVDEYDHHGHKVELPGNKLGIAAGSRYQKPELDTTVAPIPPVAELDQQNAIHNIPSSQHHERSALAELEHPASNPEGRELSTSNNPTELDTTASPQGKSHPIASPKRVPVPRKQVPSPESDNGPLPHVSQIFPTIAESGDDEELAYRE